MSDTSNFLKAQMSLHIDFERDLSNCGQTLSPQGNCKIPSSRVLRRSSSHCHGREGGDESHVWYTHPGIHVSSSQEKLAFAEVTFLLYRWAKFIERINSKPGPWLPKSEASAFLRHHTTLKGLDTHPNLVSPTNPNLGIKKKEKSAKWLLHPWNAYVT